MNKSFFKSRIFGVAVCVACTVLLPFYLLDEFHCASHQDEASNSVFMNALRFYSGDARISRKPDRYIAVVTYIGIPEDADRDNAKSSVDKIIRDHVAPAFERKGLRLELETNKITKLGLYYKQHSCGDEQVTVFCFVLSRAALALVVS